MTNHSLLCNAPICQDSCSPNLVWYAGEKVCAKKPYTKWQKKQSMINNWIKKHPFKDMERAYNTLDLNNLSI